MKSEINEYAPETHEDLGQSNNKEKTFDLVRAKDPNQLKAIRAREAVHGDPELTNGARMLFAFLLDLSLNPYVNNDRRGQIIISYTQLAERLSRSERALFGWVNELEQQRHIWVSKLPRPNMHAMNVYHITAFQPKREIRQEVAGDGMWGNGYRRPQQVMPLGARGATCKKRHLLFDAFGAPISSETLANRAPTRTEYHSLPQILREAPAQNDTCHPQSLREEPANIAGATRKKQHLPPAKSDTRPPQKPALLRESQVEIESSTETSLSCLTAEDGRPGGKNQQFSGSAALKRKAGESGFLEELTRTLAQYDPKKAEQEMVNWGGRWRNRYREDNTKAWRVLAELGAMVKEGAITSNPGAAADDLWRRFA